MADYFGLPGSPGRTFKPGFELGRSGSVAAAAPKGALLLKSKFWGKCWEDASCGPSCRTLHNEASAERRPFSQNPEVPGTPLKGLK